ncbi:MAG: isoprenylcysteine carboxylmethyltransferase family protein [Hyphomicrobiales bacterium]|nr:isoprenylcysteine carboxylmethyltransferase family protein [Hyphomicrobiales bacterium]
MTNDVRSQKSDGKLEKGVFWASAAFYALIAFEFFYMASPFAAYFYGVYGPGLGLLGDSPTGSWLVSFFLPHIVAQTSSPLINSHTIFGGTFAIIGLGGFLVGARQIYGNKLRKGQAVDGGVYRWIRHPQYLSLMVASFGMLLIWPRFLVLFGFVTLVFVYVLLARSEERLCLRQYPGYAGFMKKTGMFLPRIMETPFRLLPKPISATARTAIWIGFYVTTLGLAALAGQSVQSHAIDSLYADYTHRAATISVGALTSDEIASIHEIAARNEAVSIALAKAARDPNSRFLNYVLPTQMFISEIPMHLPEGTITTHTFPEDHNRDEYKIIFTLAETRPGRISNGRDIIADAVNKTPVVEAWIDRSIGRVLETFNPPVRAFYDGMPVPVF